MKKAKNEDDFIKALYEIEYGDYVEYLNNIYLKVPGGWLARTNNVNIPFTFIPFVYKIELKQL